MQILCSLFFLLLTCGFIYLTFILMGLTNKDIIRRIRYIFNYSDDQMIKLFALGDKVVTRAEVSDWLKKEEDADEAVVQDIVLAQFLNGLIIEKRGKKEGAPPMIPERTLNNNIIFRKLRIALNYKDTDILDTFKLADLRVSKHEISAIFRKPSQKQYRPCQDQFLRNFLQGLQIKNRD